MTHEETEAGTPVVEFDTDEYRANLEDEVSRLIGMSVPDFVRAFDAGELDESDPVVSELAALLRIGQDNHPVATA